MEDLFPSSGSCAGNLRSRRTGSHGMCHNVWRPGTSAGRCPRSRGSVGRRVTQRPSPRSGLHLPPRRALQWGDRIACLRRSFAENAIAPWRRSVRLRFGSCRPESEVQCVFPAADRWRGLRAYQTSLREQVRFEPLASDPRTIAGVDVAYRNDGTACGAYVELDAQTQRVVREVQATRDVTFPYLPGYLTFRELPVLYDVCRKAASESALADVIFVDGNGLLQSLRRAGIATCLGVVLDWPQPSGSGNRCSAEASTSHRCRPTSVDQSGTRMTSWGTRSRQKKPANRSSSHPGTASQRPRVRNSHRAQ